MEAATGDKDFWIVDVVGNFCFVHPAKQGISSNLNLITDKGNIYSFTLQDISGILGRARPEGDRRARRPLFDCRRQRPAAVRARRAAGTVETAARRSAIACRAGSGRVQERYPAAAQIRLRLQGQRSSLRYPVDLSRRQVHLHQDECAGEVQRLRDEGRQAEPRHLRPAGWNLHHPEGDGLGYVELGKKRMDFTRKG